MSCAVSLLEEQAQLTLAKGTGLGFGAEMQLEGQPVAFGGVQGVGLCRVWGVQGAGCSECGVFRVRGCRAPSGPVCRWMWG